MDREFIAERQKGLQAYLDYITHNPLLSSSEAVKKFLDPNSYSSNYTGEGTVLKADEQRHCPPDIILTLCLSLSLSLCLCLSVSLRDRPPAGVHVLSVGLPVGGGGTS